MSTILETYENKHGKRDESVSPQLWDFGLEQFEDGWLAGVVWQSSNTGDDRTRIIYTPDKYKEQLSIIDTLKRENNENEIP